MQTTNLRRLVVAVLASLALVSGCGSDDSSSSNAGSAGNADQAARTVDVNITAAGYEPATINAAKGETVTFSVTNSDTTIHEFVLGNEKTQDDYEKLMADMGTSPMLMPDTPNIINIEPGQTKSITWTFPNEETEVIYGSHQPNDYKKYKGTITVK